jgi:hypothetical protein
VAQRRHPAPEVCDLVVAELAAVGGHGDLLAAPEPAHQRIGGETRAGAVEDPLAELVLAAHQVAEIAADEPGDEAPQGTRIGMSAGAFDAVAGKAAVGSGELAAGGGLVAAGAADAFDGADPGGEVGDLAVAQVPIGGHAQVLAREPLTDRGVVEPVARRAEADELLDGLPVGGVHEGVAGAEARHRPPAAAGIGDLDRGVGDVAALAAELLGQ